MRICPLVLVFACAVLIPARSAARLRSAAKPAPQAPDATVPTAPTRESLLLSPERAVARAPDEYKVRLATTKGDLVIAVHRAWAPHGADRFYNLVKIGFFDGVEFFRVIDGFMAQVGINGDPAVAAKWRGANIPDDPASGHSNRRGAVTFANAGPGSRTTQFFVNFKDNSFLDTMGFPPIGEVVEGDAVLDKLYRGYGEGAPNGKGPDQGRIQAEGNAYLKASFPELDSIKSAVVLGEENAAPAPGADAAKPAEKKESKPWWN